MEEHIFSFAPLIGFQPKVLILGTMPSVSSLRDSEYYAHPANTFWKIMAALNQVEPLTNYDAKKKLILSSNLALWDVCHSCLRSGSLDSAIQHEEPNTIGELIHEHPSIKILAFNGQTAEKLFRRHFKASLDIPTLSLPSTSPAYTLSFEQKLAAWSQLLQFLS